MKNLISMTDYCQEVSSEFMSPKKPFDKNYWFGKILNYSDFLKQPLELWMFVPCYDKGSILEKPIKPEHPYNDKECDVWLQYEIYLERYQQAKKACLFEGFQYYIEGVIGNQIFTFSKEFLKQSIIDDLIQFDLQLTQTAIKKLGL